MPTFRSTTIYRSGDLDATRCMCDGCDPRRTSEEATTRASLWLVTSGAMKVRDVDGVRVIDPTRAIVMPAHHPFVVSHPAGPDICLGFHGPLIEELAAHGPRLIAITPAIVARISAELAAWKDGAFDELALTELLGTIASHDANAAHDAISSRSASARHDARASHDAAISSRSASARHDALASHEAAITSRSAIARHDALASHEATASQDASAPHNRARRAIREHDLAHDDTGRDLASAVARELRLSFSQSTSLGELAERTGYSVFHTCRVFQRATGHTIHGFRRELRLRHALARLLDGDEPLAQIAAATGFASQSHLTNLFRARFGITPARVRTVDGRRVLAG